MKKKLFIISSSDTTIDAFLLNHIKTLNFFFDITVISNFSNNKKKIPRIQKYNINFDRKINILSDLKVFFQLIFYQIRNRPDIVWTITPKAGFLGMLSSFILNVNCRIHIFTGQVWANKIGFYKWFLKNIDKTILRISNIVLCDGEEQKKFLILNNFKSYIQVVGKGSVCGVDLQVFKPSVVIRKKYRNKLKISKNEIVLIYTGRLCAEKGILNLVNVFNEFKDLRIKLLIIGKDEEGIKKKSLKILRKKIRNVHFINFTNNVSSYLNCADIFCMPSEREGFGVSVAEAMACELPIVGTNIYGLKDLLKNNNNSITYKSGNVAEMSKAILKLIQNKKLRSQLGKNGRKLIVKYYDKDKVTEAYKIFFKSLIK
jgi:glycosyltransferase involved in cell wall biosynthesis